MDLNINIDESIDDLQLNNLKIIQNKDGFCFGIDAVLLSDFAKDKMLYAIQIKDKLEKYAAIDKVKEEVVAKYDLIEYEIIYDSNLYIMTEQSWISKDEFVTEFYTDFYTW